MRTPTQTFNEWVVLNNFSPRFHSIPKELADLAVAFDLQRQAFDQRIQMLNGMYLPNRKIDIYCDFLDDGACDAIAGIYEFIGLIALNKGAVLLPVEMFFRMLSHPLVLQQVGNSSAERRGPQHNEGLPTNYDTLIENRRRSGKKSLLPTPPIDPVRKFVAQICMEIAWKFLANHETAHIVQGHCDYLSSAKAVSFILEATQSGNGASMSQTDLDFQAIELAADRAGSAATLRGFLTKSHHPLLLSACPKPEHRIFLWSFAMYTLFRIWGLRINPNDLRGHSHPPTLLRFEMVVAHAHLDVAEIYPELERRFMEIMWAGRDEAEKGIVYCGGAALKLEDVIGTSDDKVTDHLNALAYHLDHVISPRLKNYSYVPINPKAPIPPKSIADQLC